MPSFRKIKDKWSAVFDLPTADGKRKQKRLSGFNSRREAELAYINFKGEYKPLPTSERKETFAEVFERYLLYQEPRIKESSYIDVKRCFTQQLLPFFGSMPIEDIKPKDVIAWQGSVSQKDYSFKYKDNMLTYLKGFFNYCIHIEEILKESPAKRQIKFIETEVKREMLFYTPEEYALFRKAIAQKTDLVLFDMLYFTGMRKGELIALSWTDLKENRVSINKTYTRKTRDGKWKLTRPKSNNAVREIMLPDFLMAELMELKQEKNAKNTDFIIGGELPSNERYLDHARDKYTAASNAKRIRLHDFRHSHVSYLIGENVDIMTIAKRIGDKVETILKTYAHLMPNKETEMIKKLDDLRAKIS